MVPQKYDYANLLFEESMYQLFPSVLTLLGLSVKLRKPLTSESEIILSTYKNKKLALYIMYLILKTLLVTK